MSPSSAAQGDSPTLPGKSGPYGKPGASRLLVVMAHYPFPPRAGSSIVAFNQLRELSRSHQVQILCCDAGGVHVPPPEFLYGVEVVARKKVSWPWLLLRLLRGLDPTIARSSSAEMRRRLVALLAQHDFEALLLYEMSAIQYCPESAYPRTIVNVEDPPSIRMDRYRKLPLLSWDQKLRWLLRMALMQRYESAVLPKLGRVLALSPADVQDMRQQPRYGAAACVRYGVDARPDTELVGHGDRTPGMIIFSGNMFHLPNVDGGVFFLRQVFSRVLERCPEANLWVVGADPHPQLVRAAAPFGKRVTITGRVGDMSAYLRRAQLSVCPVRLKIGVQTKILEALSWATPVVTSSAGNSGIGGRSGEQLWVADEPARFADHVVSLMRGEDWDRLSRNGRALVAEHFSWKGSAGQLARQIESLAPSDGR